MEKQQLRFAVGAVLSTFVRLAAAVVLALALAGCGGNNTYQQPGQQSGQPPAATPSSGY